MSIMFQCDGCAAAVEKPEVVGYITKREYCPACAVLAKEFVDAEEALRKATHEKFIDERAALIANASAGGFKLPDVAPE